MLYSSLRLLLIGLACSPLAVSAVVPLRIINEWDARYKKALDLLQIDPLLHEDELTAAIQDLKDSAPDKSRDYAAQNLQVSLKANKLLAPPSADSIKEVERWISNYTLAGRTQLVSYLKKVVKQAKKDLQTKKTTATQPSPVVEEEKTKEITQKPSQPKEPSQPVAEPVEPTLPTKPTIEEAIRGDNGSSLPARIQILQDEIPGIQHTAATLARVDSDGNQRGWAPDELQQLTALKNQLETQSETLSAQDVTRAEEHIAVLEKDLAILEGIQQWEKLSEDDYQAFLGLLKTKARMRMPTEFIIQQLQREVDSMLTLEEESSSSESEPMIPIEKPTPATKESPTQLLKKDPARYFQSVEDALQTDLNRISPITAAHPDDTSLQQISPLLSDIIRSQQQVIHYFVDHPDDARSLAKQPAITIRLLEGILPNKEERDLLLSSGISDASLTTVEKYIRQYANASGKIVPLIQSKPKELVATFESYDLPFKDIIKEAAQEIMSSSPA